MQVRVQLFIDGRANLMCRFHNLRVILRHVLPNVIFPLAGYSGHNTRFRGHSEFSFVALVFGASA